MMDRINSEWKPLVQTDGYLPLEDYGLIGDGSTAALVGRDGGISWLCLPRFDSAPLFCGILDAGRGGVFKIAPEGLAESRHYYEPDTAVLVTEMRTSTGTVRLTDAMLGANPTRVSGKSAHPAVDSLIPRLSATWPSTAACAWRNRSVCPAICHTGKLKRIPSSRRSFTKPGIPASTPLRNIWMEVRAVRLDAALPAARRVLARRGWGGTTAI